MYYSSLLLSLCWVPTGEVKYYFYYWAHLQWQWQSHYLCVLFYFISRVFDDSGVEGKLTAEEGNEEPNGFLWKAEILWAVQLLLLLTGKLIVEAVAGVLSNYNLPTKNNKFIDTSMEFKYKNQIIFMKSITCFFACYCFELADASLMEL